MEYFKNSLIKRNFYQLELVYDFFQIFSAFNTELQLGVIDGLMDGYNRFPGIRTKYGQDRNRFQENLNNRLKVSYFDIIARIGRPFQDKLIPFLKSFQFDKAFWEKYFTFVSSEPKNYVPSYFINEIGKKESEYDKLLSEIANDLRSVSFKLFSINCGVVKELKRTTKPLHHNNQVLNLTYDDKKKLIDLYLTIITYELYRFLDGDELKSLFKIEYPGFFLGILAFFNDSINSSHYLNLLFKFFKYSGDLIGKSIVLNFLDKIAERILSPIMHTEKLNRFLNSLEQSKLVSISKRGAKKYDLREGAEDYYNRFYPKKEEQAENEEELDEEIKEIKQRYTVEISSKDLTFIRDIEAILDEGKLFMKFNYGKRNYRFFTHYPKHFELIKGKFSSSHLKTFTVANNRITGINLIDLELSIIPKSIGNLIELEELILYNNPLEQLPKEIGKLTKLKHLDVSDTHIKNMPESILQLPNLREIDISSTPLGNINRNEKSKKIVKALEKKGIQVRIS